jgi:predicted nucleotidyltransferase
MRDVFVSEIESTNLDEYVKQYLKGGNISCVKTIKDEAVTIFDIEQDGLKERLSFTKVSG